MPPPGARQRGTRRRRLRGGQRDIGEGGMQSADQRLPGHCTCSALHLLHPHCQALHCTWLRHTGGAQTDGCSIKGMQSLAARHSPAINLWASTHHENTRHLGCTAMGSEAEPADCACAPGRLPTACVLQCTHPGQCWRRPARAGRAGRAGPTWSPLFISSVSMPDVCFLVHTHQLFHARLLLFASLLAARWRCHGTGQCLLPVLQGHCWEACSFKRRSKKMWVMQKLSGSGWGAAAVLSDVQSGREGGRSE